MPVKKQSRHQPPQTEKQRPWRESKGTALVTGASSGIGYDLSSIFAANGYDLVIVARSREKLLALANQAQQMFGVSVKVIRKDLTDPNAPEEIYRELAKSGIAVDVLVNNAGYGLWGPYGYSDKKEEMDMIQLNIKALAHMTKLFLPNMLKRRKGKILNVASTSGFQPGPLMANYYASKSYVLNFSVGLAEEVRKSGVTVSVVCPGPTLSGFRERAGIKNVPLWRFVTLDSHEVARTAYEGLMIGKTVIVPGFLNKLGTMAGRFASRPFFARMIMRFQETRK